jgi:uncharacterized membrane protein
MKKREIIKLQKIIILIVFCLVYACILTGARNMKVKERHPRPEKNTLILIYDTTSMIETYSTIQ